MEEVSATQAARAIAADAGIEHDMGAIGGAGMPVTKGRSPKPAGTLEEPEYTVNTVGDHLFTWKDQFTKNSYASRCLTLHVAVEIFGA